jgi:hypothetical protein
MKREQTSSIRNVIRDVLFSFSEAGLLTPHARENFGLPSAD